jgi:hypothetical protein
MNIACSEDSEKSSAHSCLNANTLVQIAADGNEIQTHCVYGCKEGGCLDKAGNICTPGCPDSSTHIQCSEEGIPLYSASHLNGCQDERLTTINAYLCTPEKCPANSECVYGKCITDAMKSLKDGDKCDPNSFAEFCYQDKAYQCYGEKIVIEQCYQGGCNIIEDRRVNNSNLTQISAQCHKFNLEPGYYGTPNFKSLSYCRNTPDGHSEKVSGTFYRNLNGYISFTMESQPQRCDKSGCNADATDCIKLTDKWYCNNNLLLIAPSFNIMRCSDEHQVCATVNGDAKCRPECRGAENETVNYCDFRQSSSGYYTYNSCTRDDDGKLYAQETGMFCDNGCSEDGCK